MISLMNGWVNWSEMSIRFNVHIQNKLLQRTPVMGTHFSYELGRVSRTVGY